MISAMALTSCKGHVEPPKIIGDYPEIAASADNKIVIAVQFSTAPCNDVVFAGSHDGWYGTNGEDVAKMAKFKPVGTIDGVAWDGWYYVEVDTLNAGRDQTGACGDYRVVLEGKPVQLTSDGRFDWANQIGCTKAGDCEVSGITVKSGSVNIIPGYPGECDIHITSTAQVAIIFSQWKSSPCVTKNAAGSATFTATLADGLTLPAGAVISIGGSFGENANAWEAGVYVLTGTGTNPYTGTFGVPAEFSYKYILTVDDVNYWEDRANREMPVSLQAVDVIDAFQAYPPAPPAE